MSENWYYSCPHERILIHEIRLLQVINRSFFFSSFISIPFCLFFSGIDLYLCLTKLKKKKKKVCWWDFNTLLNIRAIDLSMHCLRCYNDQFI